MTALKTTPNIKETLPALSVSEDELKEVLRNSLYPGAQDASIKLVLSYCRAAGLDPMQKPVHIVPMWSSKAGAMVDTIMPGIGLYRTQASRTGQFAGMSEPEFGPMIIETIGGAEVCYPEFCKVTVKRALPNGIIAEFVAVEYWIENYAVKGGKEKSVAPNAMWSKRPRGQIIKCAEAQAMRKAFPEMGAAPTADEMEGKSLDDGATTFDNETGKIITAPPQTKDLPPYPDEQLSKNLSQWQDAINAKKMTPHDIVAKIMSRYLLTPEQAKRIYDLKKQDAAPKMTQDTNSFVSEMEQAEGN